MYVAGSSISSYFKFWFIPLSQFSMDRTFPLSFYCETYLFYTFDLLYVWIPVAVVYVSLQQDI